MTRLQLGVQLISRRDLERAAARGSRLNTVVLGWTHVSRSVPRELADRALGNVVGLGPRTGFRRLGRH